ncbi:MAG TPA: response regulator [Candidatus Thermoplasmatota archaeon]|nr:response regulator [Candidatus Thermoplasmatota archaeon]
MTTQPEDGSSPKSSQKPARTVFWAEDAMDDQFLIRTAVEGMKPRPEVTFFEDGEMLLDALGKKRPDLVVLDIRMPRLDGIETLRRIRARPGMRNLPVVMFSTAMIDEEVAECKQLEVRDFLQKPGHYSEFSAAVERIIGNKAQPRIAGKRVSSGRPMTI